MGWNSRFKSSRLILIFSNKYRNLTLEASCYFGFGNCEVMNQKKLKESIFESRGRSLEEKEI